MQVLRSQVKPSAVLQYRTTAATSDRQQRQPVLGNTLFPTHPAGGLGWLSPCSAQSLGRQVRCAGNTVPWGLLGPAPTVAEGLLSIRLSFCSRAMGGPFSPEMLLQDLLWDV